MSAVINPNKAILNFTLSVRQKVQRGVSKMGRVGEPERLTPAHPPPTPPPEAEGDGVKGWKRAGLMRQLRGQSPLSNRKEEKFSLGSVIGQKKEIKSIQTGKEDPSCHCVWMPSSRTEMPPNPTKNY